MQIWMSQVDQQVRFNCWCILTWMLLRVFLAVHFDFNAIHELCAGVCQKIVKEKLLVLEKKNKIKWQSKELRKFTFSSDSANKKKIIGRNFIIVNQLEQVFKMKLQSFPNFNLTRKSLDDD